MSAMAIWLAWMYFVTEEAREVKRNLKRKKDKNIGIE
jgi:hypothetical protein